MSTYELDDAMVRAWLEGHPDGNFSNALKEQLPIPTYWPPQAVVNATEAMRDGYAKGLDDYQVACAALKAARPTREQIAEAVHNFHSDHQWRLPEVCRDWCPPAYLRMADAVLVLLPPEEQA